MNINLSGNTLVKGYFEGIVLPPPLRGRWKIVTGHYTALLGDRIQADTRSMPLLITLPPTASTGDKIFIQDASLTWNTNNLTISGNGLKINGGSANYVSSLVGGKLSLVYISTPYGWSIK